MPPGGRGGQKLKNAQSDMGSPKMHEFFGVITANPLLNCLIYILVDVVDFKFIVVFL